MQSRYYDPAVKRFINADTVVSGVGGELLGYNQYAYSFNNPVNLFDESGEWPEWTKKALIVGAVAWTIVAATAVTIATCGAGSAAGVAMITGSITIAAKTMEVSVLQKRKSETEGKSDLDVAGDVVESLCDNGQSIIGATPVFKAGGILKDHYICSGGLKAMKNTPLIKTLRMPVLDKSLPYFVANLLDTLRSDDPMERAEDRGIVLN